MENIRNYKKVLANLGLTEKESEVYLTLSRIGSASAYKIAQQSSIKRSTVYVILEDLRQKDLISKLPHPHTQIFSAKSLDEYLDVRKNAIEEGKRLANELKEHAPRSQNEIRHYEGFEGVKNAVLYKSKELDGGSSSAILGHLTDNELISIFEEWHKRARESENFTMRVLIDAEDYKNRFRTLGEFMKTSNYIETRLIGKVSLPHDFSFEVFENKEQQKFLRIIADKAQHATIIETNEVTDAFRQLFNALWESGDEATW